MTTYNPSQPGGDQFDVIVIGAGINGAGVARDAAMRGLKVLMLEQKDIGGGSSACSTRLIHGGLRYLEHGEFGLVRESLREREILLRIAPHLVRPLPILVPIYAGQKRGPLTIRAGMIAYNLLSFDKTLPAHRLLSRARVLRLAQGLKADGLRAAVLYYDAQVEFAERLVLENVLSAVQNGATVRTYSTVRGFLAADGQVRGVSFTDQLTGEKHQAMGRLLINAAGPWIDQLLGAAGLPSVLPLIGGTKGSHLIVSSFPGAPATAVYVEAAQDQRPIFIIPWNENYLIGTTDIRYNDSLDRVEIDDREIEYLLTETNRFIPAAQLSRESILFTYAGVRPLAYATNRDEEGITRRHFIREHSQLTGLMSLVGGKLTTYRSLAEETVDLCFRRLGRQAPKCTTAVAVLPGATSDFTNSCEELKKEYRLSEPTVARLLRLYGVRAVEVLKLVKEDEQLCEVFDPETGAVSAEVVFSFKEEMATTLSDCLLRRTMVGLNSTCGLAAVKPAANIAQRFLGWSDQQARNEIERYRTYVERMHPRGVQDERHPTFFKS
ncbi:MAG TPA: glycerol-3-phosphate dehydrogenase [Pyrinomonadaceae bacterium]|nr:glycerol-3-phosphate dehydrogenase [Pyrinomonadaceae bacterium]